MTSSKLCAAVFVPLVVLALSMPVIAQEATQSTTTTTTAAETHPETRTTETTESKTKYRRHHHRKEVKERQTITTESHPVHEEH